MDWLKFPTIVVSLYCCHDETDFFHLAAGRGPWNAKFRTKTC